MSGNSSLAAWTARVEGQLIGSGECFALWQDYCVNVVGAPATISADVNTGHPGYAIGVWDGYAVNGASQWFEQLSATATAQPGDVAFWHYGNVSANFQTAFSHVAIVQGDFIAALDVESQNSPQRYAKRQTLSKIGLAGYFRPRNAVATPGGVPALASDTVSKVSSNVVDTLGSLFGHFGDPAFWKRVGLFALGSALALLVIVQLFAPQLLPSTS